MAKTPPALAPINFVTGTLGSGKSYLAQRYAADYLRRGKIVATNYDFVGRWWETIQLMRGGGIFEKMERFNQPPPTLMDHRARMVERAEILKLAYRFDVQDDLYDYRLPGEGEDRGLLIMDEQALQMNTRNWEERKKRELEAYGNAMRSLQFYINMRKLGWSALIISHSHEQLDSQLRHMGGAIIRCRNLAKVNIPFTTVKMFRKPRFVAIHIWPETKPAHIFKREVYGLDLPIASMYKSMDEFDANPERLGFRHQSRPLPKVAIYPAQPKFTWDEGARKRHLKRLAERAGTTSPADAGEVYGGSPGSWRTS